MKVFTNNQNMINFCRDAAAVKVTEIIYVSMTTHLETSSSTRVRKSELF